MPLNKYGIPCERVGLWVDEGTQRVAVGTKKKKRGRGYQEVTVYTDQPIKKKIWKLIPASERGWRKEIVYEIPEVDQRRGKIELVQYHLTRERFICAGCNTSKYVRLRLMGWSYDKFPTLEHHGSGVVRRCFKCDTTTGPIASRDFGERTVLKENITPREAVAVLRKYGLDIPSALRNMITSK